MHQTFWKWATNFHPFSFMAVGVPLPPLAEEESRVRRGLGILWTRGWVLGEQRQLESWALWDSCLASWLASVPGREETKEFPKSLCLSLCLAESVSLPCSLSLSVPPRTHLSLSLWFRQSWQQWALAMHLQVYVSTQRPTTENDAPKEGLGLRAQGQN